MTSEQENTTFVAANNEDQDATSQDIDLNRVGHNGNSFVETGSATTASSPPYSPLSTSPVSLLSVNTPYPEREHFPQITRVNGDMKGNEERHESASSNFDKIPTTQAVEFSCAYLARILLHGRMLVFDDHLEFHSNILGHKTDLKILFSDVTDCTKRNSAYVVPNALEIVTRSSEVHFFSSFSNRDQAYSLIHGFWIQGMKNLYEPYKIGSNTKSPSKSKEFSYARKKLALDEGSGLTNSPSSHVNTSNSKKIESTPEPGSSPSDSVLSTQFPPSPQKHESIPDLKRRNSMGVLPVIQTDVPNIRLPNHTSTPTPTTTSANYFEDRKTVPPTDALPIITVTVPDNAPHSMIDYLYEQDEIDHEQVHDIFQTSIKMQPIFTSVLFPVCTTELFDILLGNKSNFLREFHEKVHDLSVEIDPWVDLNSSGVPIARGIMFKIDGKNSAFGPLFTSKPVASMLETVRLTLTKNKQNTQANIVLHSSLVTQNLSRDEMFQIDTKYFIIDKRKSTSLRKECKLDIHIGTNCKGTFWKTSPEPNAIKAAKKRLEVWLDLAQEYVQKHHKRKMEAQYDQERSALEANILAAMAQLEDVPNYATKLLLPVPPLLHPSPPPSPRQRDRLKERFTQQELMKPEMPLPSINQSHNFNHRHVHYSTDDKMIREEYMESYTHYDHSKQYTAWHDDDYEEVFIDGHWREQLPTDLGESMEVDKSESNNGSKQQRRHANTSQLDTAHARERQNSHNLEQSISMELVDMLVKPKTNFNLFDGQNIELKKEQKTQIEELQRTEEKVDSSKLDITEESKQDSSLLTKALQIIQLIIGVLMDITQATISFFQRHGSSTMIVVILFAVLWTIYYNIRINHQFASLSSELDRQTKDNRDQFALAKDLLTMTQNDYDSKAVRNKILSYMIENDKIIPSILRDDSEEIIGEGPSVKELIEMMEKELQDLRNNKNN